MWKKSPCMSVFRWRKNWIYNWFAEFKIPQPFFRVLKLHEASDLMYIIPPYRFTVYAFGIYLGYLLRNFKSFKFSKNQMKIGWLISGVCFVIISSISMYNQNYSPLAAALFSGIAPIPLCIALTWIIFTAHMGHKSEAKIWLGSVHRMCNIEEIKKIIFKPII